MEAVNKFTIFKMEWVTERTDPDRPDDYIPTLIDAYKAWVKFFLENGLFAEPSKWQEFNDWMHLEYSSSDLTEEGLKLERMVSDRWLDSLDRKKDVARMDMWVKALKRLRERN